MSVVPCPSTLQFSQTNRSSRRKSEPANRARPGGRSLAGGDAVAPLPAMARNLRPRVVMMASDWIPASPAATEGPQEHKAARSPPLEQRREMERILPAWVPGSPNTQIAAMERDLALTVHADAAVHCDSIVHDHPLR